MVQMKKQSNRDMVMNENMKLIYKLLLKVDLKNSEVDKEILQVNNKLNQINNKLTQIQNQFIPKKLHIDLNNLEQQNVINLLIAIVRALKVKINTIL